MKIYNSTQTISKQEPRNRNNRFHTSSLGRLVIILGLTIGFLIVTAALGYLVYYLAFSKSTYNSSCNKYRQCEPSEMTLCDGKCVCDLSYYWNGKKCLQRKSFNETCMKSSECHTSLLGLSCINSYCLCSPSHYWFGSLCLGKHPNGTNCQSNSQCQDNNGLQCTSTLCLCNSKQFWYEEKKCIDKFTNGTLCKATHECQDFNGLSCSNLLCVCASTHFWNGTKCVDKFTLNQACSFNYQCQDFLSLFCQNQRCSCLSTQFWNGLTCTNKLPNGSLCSTNNHCQDHNNLLCTNGVCLCSYTQFWNGTRCVSKFTNGTSCVSTYQCQDYQNLKCTTGVCQCVTTEYWNRLLCTTKLDLNTQCSFDYQCKDSIGLVCDNSVRKCLCDRHARHFWSTYYENCQYCPNGWTFAILSSTYFSCYFISTTIANYQQSQSNCQASNAHLLIVNDATEYNYFLNQKLTLFIADWYYIGMQGYCSGGFVFYSPYVGYVSGFMYYNWWYTEGCVFGAAYCCNYNCGCWDNSIVQYGNPNFMVWHGSSIQLHNTKAIYSYRYICEKL